jgi:hypothetical protein
MPFQTGTASSFSDLQSKIETFLTGTPAYTLTSGVLTKTGTQIHVAFSNVTDNIILEMGKDSSGGTLLYKHPVLPLTTTQIVGMGTNYYNSTAIVWPVNYDFQYYATPVEMFRCVIEYNNGYTQNIGYGEISKAVAMDGGVYIDASGTYERSTTVIGPNAVVAFDAFSCNTSGTANELSANPLPFGYGEGIQSSANSCATQLWAEFMGMDWWMAGHTHPTHVDFNGTKYDRYALSAMTNLRTTQHCSKEFENALQTHNANNALVPIRLYGQAPDENYHAMGYINDIRYTNIKNLSFGQVMDDGTDKWKCYPAFFKNAASLDGSASDSGQLGYAVRYDGP